MNVEHTGLWDYHHNDHQYIVPTFIIILSVYIVSIFPVSFFIHLYTYYNIDVEGKINDKIF